MSKAIRAAGLALVMPDNTALFLKRAPNLEHGGTWALPAGHVEADERPLDTAIRETREETSFVAPDGAEKPKEVHGTTNGFAAFKQRVTSQFIPTLNEEHTAWAWAPLDDPPQPLHPGLDKMLPRMAVDAGPMNTKSPHVGGDPDNHLLRAIREAVEAGEGNMHEATSSHPDADPVVHDQMATTPNAGLPAAAMLRRKAENALEAEDMTPEDWRDLVGGLLEFFGEEAKEPEHAEDAEFNESDHPRDQSGKFGSGGGGGGGKKLSNSKTAAKLKHEFHAVGGVKKPLSELSTLGTRNPKKMDLKEIDSEMDAIEDYLDTHPSNEKVAKERKNELIHESQLRPRPALGKDMEPEQWRGLVSGLLKFFKEEAAEPEHAADMATDAEPKTLYVNRPLKNAAAVIAWARAAGFKKTLPAHDMHVTIAFSRTPVDWTKVGSDDYYAQNGKAVADLTVPEGGARMLERFGDAQDAVVLLFNSSRLSWRHEAIKAAGASWDWPEYQPHITITYEGADVDLSDVEPYKGPLEFGPEEFAEVDEDWKEKLLAGDAKTQPEHVARIEYDGDFNMAGLLRHMHSLGSMGASRDVIAMNGDDKPVKFNFDGDGADKIWTAEIDGHDALKDGAEDDTSVHAGSVRVDAEHDGPWMSCMSRDGRTMYRNRNVPAEVELSDGTVVDVDDMLLHHERPEWEDLEKLLKVFKEQTGREPSEQEAKVLYQGAHDRSGTPSEKFYAEKNGVNWKKWSAWCRGEEARIEKGPFENEPEDADVKPIPHGHGELAAATDSALKMALDRDSVREFDKDGRMHVVEANICKACVSPYMGSEIPGADELGLDPNRTYKLLRPAEEIEKAAATSNGIQILQRHVPVDVDDHRPFDIVGSTGSDAKFEYPYLKNSLHFWTQQAIDGIESGERQNLSPGYHYTPVMKGGTFEGEDFDGMMTELCFNHLSTVPQGRQGTDVIVGDSADGIVWAALERELASFMGT